MAKVTVYMDPDGVGGIVGHAFIGLTDDNGVTKYYGFYPESNPFNGIGVVRDESIILDKDKDKLDTNNNGIPDRLERSLAIASQDISTEQFNTMLDTVNNRIANPGTYNLFGDMGNTDNCATFVGDILKSGGITNIYGSTPKLFLLDTWNNATPEEKAGWINSGGTPENYNPSTDAAGNKYYITDQMKAELNAKNTTLFEELWTSGVDALSTIGQLAEGVATDIKSFLTDLLGYTNLSQNITKDPTATVTTNSVIVNGDGSYGVSIGVKYNNGNTANQIVNLDANGTIKTSTVQTFNPSGIQTGSQTQTTTYDTNNPSSSKSILEYYDANGNVINKSVSYSDGINTYSSALFADSKSTINNLLDTENQLSKLNSSGAISNSFYDVVMKWNSDDKEEILIAT